MKIRLKMNSIHYIKIVLLLFLLNGCGCRPPLNLTIAKERVEEYYESGCYQKELKKIISCAIKRFEKIDKIPQNATVIFDIDETALSNYADEKSISFGYIPKLSHEWILGADSPAIPEVKHFYDYLVNRGFKIVFLTGRKYYEYDATIKNLKREGFTTFEKLIVRQKNELEITAESYKSNRRRQLTQEGYNIVGCIGDQASDLSGGYSGYQIKVPNYKYLIR